MDSIAQYESEEERDLETTVKEQKEHHHHHHDEEEEEEEEEERDGRNLKKRRVGNNNNNNNNNNNTNVLKKADGKAVSVLRWENLSPMSRRRLLLASASMDGVIRLWNPPTSKDTDTEPLLRRSVALHTSMSAC
jgi:WD40 repeat protein